MSDLETDEPVAGTVQEEVAAPPGLPLTEHLSLGAGFATADRDRWRALVAGVLARRGPAPDDVEAALSTTTADGIVIAPLYTREDAPPLPGPPGFAPFTRGRRAARGSSWDVRARCAEPDPQVAHTQVLEDLEHGVTSLWLALGPAGTPVADLGTVLADVYLDLAAVVLDAGADYAAAAQALLDVAAARDVDLAALSGNLGGDPVAVLARTGQAVDAAPAAALAVRATAELPGLRAMVVDALPWHEAGGTDAEELGLSLAHGVAYLRLLTGAGLTTAQAAAQLEFRYAATADQFATIAKLRAARRLWSRVTEASGVPPEGRGQQQHAVTSWTMTTTRDPWVTLLRDTLATFAAGVGGADAVTVLPFDAPLGRPGALSRRMARNTSAVLVEESHVARVTDPAGGSWYVESLTDELARAAWAVFQDVERTGGVEAGLRDGSVAARLARSADARRARLARRQDAVTGVSEYPFLDEKPLIREASPPVPAGGLPRLRWSEDLEALRDRSDRQRADTGSRPHVVAVTWGPLKAHVARLDFVRNLLLPGGVETREVAADALADALADRVPEVVVLVAADTVEAATVAPVVADLRTAGAVRVLRAGRPADPDAWPFVDGFVHAGMDALALLTSLYPEEQS